jgi:hypothetical protein
MKPILRDPRERRSRTPSSPSKLSGLTILGKHFAVIWRGHGWELVAVVALLIVALLAWLKLR